MNDMEFLLNLLKRQTAPVNLNQVCACIPAVPKSNVKEMLEYMGEKGLVKIDGTFGLPGLPRLFSVA